MSSPARNDDDFQDSEDLLSRAAAGDRPALSELVERHQPGLYAYVRLHAGHKVRAREETADLVQGVLLEVVRGFDDFEWRGEAAFKAWLYEKALRRVIDRARFIGRAKRDPARETPLADGTSGEVQLAQVCRDLMTPSQIAVRKEQVELIEIGFQELPEADREVLSLAFLCGMKSGEIAERLGLTVDAARKRRDRALVRLAARIQE